MIYNELLVTSQYFSLLFSISGKITIDFVKMISQNYNLQRIFVLIENFDHLFYPNKYKTQIEKNTSF